MDDLELVIRGHELSTSESIYALGKEYYEAMFRENINVDNILQIRQEVHPWIKVQTDGKEESK